jgi:hypothetical protein
LGPNIILFNGIEELGIIKVDAVCLGILHLVQRERVEKPVDILNSALALLQSGIRLVWSDQPVKRRRHAFFAKVLGIKYEWWGESSRFVSHLEI